MTALRKWDKIPEEKRRAIVQDLIDYFERERDEKIGVIAAGELYDFFMESAGKDIFNLGVQEAKKAMETRLDELRYDLDDLGEA